MKFFFVNTDAVSYNGVSMHDEWIRRCVIVTSGKSQFKDALARIQAGSRVLVYVNNVGVVAEAEVESDVVMEVLPPDTVSGSDPAEYHKSVRWVMDIRDNPISREELVDMLGQGPIHAVQEIRVDKINLLNRLSDRGARPTLDQNEYIRIASDIFKQEVIGRPVGSINPQNVISSCTNYYRDPKVRAWVMKRANGCCELCSQMAPFYDIYGDPYLESHHITMLANGGADTPENTAALCPNCHRELHFGVGRQVRAEILRNSIIAKDVLIK